MTIVEKLGEPRDVWLQCPSCSKLYYIERLFYEPAYNKLKVKCPFCRTEFDKADAPQVWGV